MHKNVRKFLHSFVAFPVMAASLVTSPLLATTGLPNAAVISPDSNRPLASVVAANQQSDLDIKAQKVDAYFAKYDLPLEGKGDKLVAAAKENDLPPYLVAALAVVESTGGKFACKNDRDNAFGYGSCKGVKFDSVDEAIDTVARTIAGNSPKTARYYDGKDIRARLETYNGRANPKYVQNVMWVMDQF